MPTSSDILGPLAARYGRPNALATRLDPFEALVATVLDRLTEPRKALAARLALRDDGLLEAQALAEADPAELTESLRSAGVTIPEKSFGPLRKLARWLVDRHHGSADDLAGPDAEAPTSQLRDELIDLRGVGPATADAILLFALGRPVYPVDRATYRVFVRHGWLDTSADYDEARSAAESLAPDDAETLALLSGWLERLGRDHCRASVARCDRLSPRAPLARRRADRPVVVSRSRHARFSGPNARGSSSESLARIVVGPSQTQRIRRRARTR